MPRHLRSGVRRGDTIKNGRYEILDLIGRGGMSRVFLASDTQLANKQWAVKEIYRYATDETGRPIEQKLMYEAEIMSKIDHPGIVDIVDIEKTNDYIYVIMDHVPGETLDKLVRREGPQSEEDVQNWMLQVCDALEYLHSRKPPIIHRDLKPSNMILNPDGYVKLIDLGVAREYKDGASKDTMPLGTRGYAAPEQSGTGQSDARTDIYGLGVTMWHLLSGQTPPDGYERPDVRTLNPSVGEGFAEVIIPKCTQLDRERRYQSVAELAADLEVYNELTREYHNRQKRKVVSFAVTGAAAVVFALAGCGFLALREGTITENWNYQMQIGDSLRQSGIEEDIPEAEDAYKAAIEMRPANTAAWEGLVNCYDADADFNQDEKEELDTLFRRHQSELRASSGYAHLCYEIGRLYWYSYSYGNNSGDPDENRATRIRSSIEYFRIAQEDPNIPDAKIYYQIADFTTNIALAVHQDDDTEQDYATYWDNLQSLAEMAEGEEKDGVRLDCYELILNAMETYTERFDAAGVTKDDMERMSSAVQRGLATVVTAGSTEMEAQKTAAQARLTTVNRKITTVYSGTTVAGR